jgi:cysteinyl-tRNA synthetase
MSKSSGGFITLKNLLDEGYHPLDYRYFLLGGHYRSQLHFSYSALDGAKSARRSLSEKLRSLSAQAEAVPVLPSGSKAAAYISAFDKALTEDLSTPRALAELWGLLKDSSLTPAEALAAAFDMDAVLALNLREEAALQPQAAEDNGFIAEIEKLIEERKQAKAEKNFARADEIRQDLKEKGFILEDSPAGTSWRKS